VTGLNVNDGVWRHFVLVIDGGGNWKVYLNGVLIRTYSNEYYPPSKTRVLNYLGRSNWATDSYSNGAIDEFYMFFSVLSASDVQALYNAGETRNSVEDFSGKSYVEIILLARFLLILSPSVAVL